MRYFAAIIFPASGARLAPIQHFSAWSGEHVLKMNKPGCLRISQNNNNNNCVIIITVIKATPLKN